MAVSMILPTLSLVFRYCAGRRGVGRTLLMVMAFAETGAKRHRKILRDNIQGITKPAIRRLARRGGGECIV